MFDEKLRAMRAELKAMELELNSGELTAELRAEMKAKLKTMEPVAAELAKLGVLTGAELKAMDLTEMPMAVEVVTMKLMRPVLLKAPDLTVVLLKVLKAEPTRAAMDTVLKAMMTAMMMGMVSLEELSKALKIFRRKPLKIQRSPGFNLLSVAEFLYSQKTYTEVFEPIVRDLQDEYNEALAAQRLWKVRYVRVRGYCAFWSAVGTQCSGSLVKNLLKALGAASSSAS